MSEERRQWFVGAGIFLTLFTTYLLSASHTVTLEDSGEFLLTSHFWGVAHPPGYPLYTMLGKIFSLLPLGSLAYRIHVLSALLAALACAILYACGRRLFKSRTTAALVALLYGASQTFWSQAIVAEVYALNVLFFLSVFYLCLRLSEAFNRKEFLLMCFVFGLSLTNHWPLMILSAPVYLLSLWPERKKVIQNMGWGSLMFLLGLLPYGLLLWRSQLDGEMVFSGPIRGIGEFFNYITRQEYMSLEETPTAGPWDSLRFFGEFIVQSTKEFGYLAAPLILAGLYFLREQPRRVIALFTVGILSSSLILKFFEINDFEPINVQTYRAYQLIPYAFFALAMGYATEGLSKKFKMWAVSAPLVVLLAAIGQNFSVNNMRNETLAKDYAAAVLESLPQNAKLFVFSETDANPIGFVHYIEGVRPDVEVYSQLGLLFHNRIFDPNSLARTKAAKTKNFFAGNEPIFLSAPLFFLEEPQLIPLTINRNGFFYVVAKEPFAASEAEALRRAREVLDSQRLNRYRGAWTFHAGFIYSSLCGVLARNNVDHPMAVSNSNCKLEYALEKFRKGDFGAADELLTDLVSAPKFLNKAEDTQLANIYAQSKINTINSKRLPDSDRQRAYQEVAEYLMVVADDYQSCKNAVVPTLIKLHKAGGVKVDIEGLSKKFSACQESKGLW